MVKIYVGQDNSVLEGEVIKFSDNPIYFGVGYKVGSTEWKLLKSNDILKFDNKKFVVKQHVDVGDFTWFLFTSK